MKKIKIYTGDTNIKLLFENGLHPKNQIKKVISYLNSSPDIFSIFSNSAFVVEAFNKFGKVKGYKIDFFFNHKKMNAEKIFLEFSKPFEKLIFEDDNKKEEYNVTFCGDGK